MEQQWNQSNRINFIFFKCTSRNDFIFKIKDGIIILLHKFGEECWCSRTKPVIAEFSFEKKVEISEDENVFEALTLASIIEKEVRTTEERKIAAGIFLNRLDGDIALQSDATVNYVTGKATTMPSLEDLQVNHKLILAIFLLYANGLFDNQHA